MAKETIPEFLRIAASERGDAIAYLHKVDGAWKEISWAENASRCKTIARALMALDVAAGDRVAILSQTRVEWVQCDLAIACCGAATVGVYPSSLAEDCAYVLDHSDAEVVFIEDQEQLRKLASVRDRIPRVKHWVALDPVDDDGLPVIPWDAFLARAAGVPAEAVDARAAAVAPEDLASIVYTSGTTGVPKGAVLTHANFLFSAQSAAQALDLGTGRIFLLFLPLAHVFARLTVHLSMVTGNTIAFAESMQRVADNMKEVRPHYMAGVPRMFEKIHDRILGEVRRKGGAREAIFSWALGVGMRAAALERARKPIGLLLRVQRAIAHALAFRKIHAALGGRVIYLISGAAPLDMRTAEFFHAIGVLILEGIGMTENTSFTHVNRRDRYRFGTVGLTGPGVEARIAPDGEVLVRGPNVMKAYHKDPVGTAETIDPDGWQRTGDVGEIDSEGFLTITDRKKDLIVTSGGKNIAPQRIEHALTASPLIAQAVVFGDRQKYLAALVVPDFEAIRAVASGNGKGAASPTPLAGSAEVQALVGAEVDAVNRRLASYETVKKFRLLPAELSIEGGELTPTLKVRRKVVAEKYRSLIAEMFED